MQQANTRVGILMWAGALLARTVALVVTAILVLTGGIGAAEGGQQRGRGAGAAEPQPTPGLIVGRVVDADSGQPVAEAQIDMAMRTDRAPTGVPVRLLTGTDGRFVVRDVPLGNVQLSAQAPGYLNGTYGQTRPGGPPRPLSITAKEPVVAATIRLWRPAVVTGMVTDEANEPAINIRVRALRQSFVGGRPQYVGGGTGETDDRGRYRIAGLTPGTYVVVVPQTVSSLPVAAMNSMMEGVVGGQGFSAATMELAGSGVMPAGGLGVRVDGQLVSSASGATPVLGGDGRMGAYLTQYYPDAESPSRATTLVLGSGEERASVDIRMPLVPTVTVGGTVVGPEGPMANVTVRLATATADRGADALNDVARAATAADGTFEMHGVPAGSYVARVLRMPRRALPAALANNPQLQALMGGRGGGPASPVDNLTLFAEVPLSADRDVTDVVIPLSQAASVSGRLEFVGSANPVTLTGMRVTLVAVDGQSSAVAPAQVTDDGQFSTKGYPPGRYVINATGRAPGWFLASAMVNGVNALERPFELETEDIGNVVLTFTDRRTVLTGTVTGPSGTPVEGAVVLFPSDYQAWINQGMVARLMRRVRTSPTGAFSMPNLLPRDYLIVAVPDEVMPDVQDPSVFAALARAATTVTLSDGDTRTISIKLTEVVR